MKNGYTNKEIEEITGGRVNASQLNNWVSDGFFVTTMPPAKRGVLRLYPREAVVEAVLLSEFSRRRSILAFNEPLKRTAINVYVKRFLSKLDNPSELPDALIWVDDLAGAIEHSGTYQTFERLFEHEDYIAGLRDDPGHDVFSGHVLLVRKAIVSTLAKLQKIDEARAG